MGEPEMHTPHPAPGTPAPALLALIAEGAIPVVAGGGECAVITGLDRMEAGLAGRTGTTVEP